MNGDEIWLKLAVLTAISMTLIGIGVVWYRKSLRSTTPYDLAEDFRRSFLSPHGSYSGFYNDGKPRRIVPVLTTCGGLGLLILGWAKILSG